MLLSEELVNKLVFTLADLEVDGVLLGGGEVHNLEFALQVDGQSQKIE